MPPHPCPSCRQEMPEGQRFCGHCGADTMAPTVAATATSIPEAGGFPAPGDGQGRFDPGTVIAGRYRIVGLLGRGGMGEVYRADDLKLARPVALKFLPGSVEHAPGRLNRLLNEVRSALRVSHPNVCRVHDVHEEAGRHFITMEFVDGDDLSALLRRIGRLPPDKALEIARQLCAGLGAAHAAGVLHRDLKPANIMIDGRGQVKITDFGLAGLAGGFGGEEIRAGTPAYMSPEQLAGKDVTQASDLYALGLVLYEVYTGRPAFEGGTVAELVRKRASAPTSPSSHITDIDPAVERAILRCLESDPAERPRSALAVSAALPGGDPLADALAAGETPAPELVAEAGAVGGLKPAWAWALMAGFVVLLGLNIAGVERFNPISRADLPRSAAVLEGKAKEVLASLGFDETPRDSIYEFEFNADYVRHLNAETATPESWARLERTQPAVLIFGYRQSPEWITYESAGSVAGWIRRSSPDFPGAVRIRLDPVGRLLWLDAVPRDRERTGEDAAPREANWSALLQAAGLDEAAFREVNPEWVPPRGFDERRAWEGAYPDAPEVKIRVEAASLAGRAVAFRIVEPWTQSIEDASDPSSGPGAGGEVGAILGPALWILSLATVGFFAWRNLRLGRGDRRTAVRFALALAALRLGWYVFTHHTASGDEIGQLQAHLAWSLYRFGLAYAFYLAIEPYARKLWPRMLTSWVRLFDNRFHDPLVGRDLLVGLFLSVALSNLAWLLITIVQRYGLAPMNFALDEFATEALRGFPGAAMSGIGMVTQAMFGTFFFVTLIFLFRLVLRRDGMTLIAMILLGIAFDFGRGPILLSVVLAAVIMTTFWVALFRFGLLTFVVFMTTQDLMQKMPLTFDLASWWAAPTWITLASLLFLAAWGFRMSLAGRPVFRERLFEG